MNLLKKNYKKILFFVFFFVFFFILNYICNYQNMKNDTMWNYSFSHAIRIGEIPYKDFNIISTPLFSFIMSIGLFIYDDMIVFLLEHTILIVLLFSLFIKEHGNKGWIMLPMLTLPFFSQLNGTYNFFAFLLVIIILMLEKRNKSDYIIGLLLGLLIITKQTIGLSVLLFSLIGTFNIRRIIKRFSIAMIPCLLLFIYLLITNSFNQFIDLCFLGMFDFGTKNQYIILPVVIMVILALIFILFNIIRNPKNKYLYYALACVSFTIPIFDYTHSFLFLSVLVFIFIDKIKLDGKYIRNVSFIFVFLIAFLYLLIVPNKFNNITLLNQKNLNYFIITKEEKESIIEILDKYKKYDNAYIIDDASIIFDLAANKKITYYDVLLKGNYGYKGTNKMINKVKNTHNTYYFVNMHRKVNTSSDQFDTDIVDYIIKNSKKVDEIQSFNIYYKE